MKKKLLAVLLVVITVVPVFAGNGRFFLSLGPAGNYNSWKSKEYKQDGGSFTTAEGKWKFGGIGADFSVVIQPNKDSVFSIFIDEYAGFPIGKMKYVEPDEGEAEFRFSFLDNLAFGPAATFGRNGDFLNGTIGLGPSLGYTSIVTKETEGTEITNSWNVGLSLGVAAFGQLMFNINDMFYIDLVAVPSIRFIQWGRNTWYTGDRRTDSAGWFKYTIKGFEFDVKAKVGFGVKLGNKDM